MGKNRLILGCGYLGTLVAELWRSCGDQVTVVTRSPTRAKDLEADGYRVLVADVTKPETLGQLSAITRLDTLLFAVGYDRGAGPSIHQVYADGFRNALRAAPPQTKRILYISTTGVYGPADGGVVDEQTTPNPGRDGGRASLAAEKQLASSPFAERGVVLRLAGIYGPGRIPFLKQLQAGEPIGAPQAGWLNLIHVDDAARIVAAAADVENVSQLHNVSDGSPVLRGDYYQEVARLIGAPAPAFVDPPANSPRAARAAADKRVSNQRMLAELGVGLDFPSYREGLSSILGNHQANG